MIRARVYKRRDGGLTVRCRVPWGEAHPIEVTGPCRVVVSGAGASVDVASGDTLFIGPLLGPFSYTVRYRP